MKFTLEANGVRAEFEADEELLAPAPYRERRENLALFWDRYLLHALAALGEELAAKEPR